MPTDDTRTPDRPPKPPARRCIVSVDGVRCPEPPRYPGRDESSFCSTHDDPDNAETKAWQQAIARREPDWRTMPTDDTRTPDPLRSLWDAIHDLRWCKSSDLLHALAHDDTDEDGYRARLCAALAARPAPDSGPDDLTAAAAFMLELVDQYYGTDHEFDIPEEARFRYFRAVIEEANGTLSVRAAQGTRAGQTFWDEEAHRVDLPARPAPGDECPGKPAPGRWAFFDTETGDWIEVAPGVVHIRAKEARP